MLIFQFSDRCDNWQGANNLFSRIQIKEVKNGFIFNFIQSGKDLILKKWHFAFIFISKHAVLLNSTNQLIHPNVSFVFSFESFSFVFERCCVLDFKVRILWVLCKRGFYKVQLRFWCAATLNLPTSSQAPSRLLWICKTSGLSWLHFSRAFFNIFFFFWGWGFFLFFVQFFE